MFPGRRGNRGRGREQGGRGRGRFNEHRRPREDSNRERELKFSPNQFRGTTAAYATTKEAVIQQIQKNYIGGQDVAKSLDDMQLVDLTAEAPIRGISTKTDAAEKAVEQDGLNIKYQEELRRHLDRKDALKEGLNKAYALIYTDYCTKAMQSRIEEHPEYLTLKNNPIAVLEAIKTLTQDPVRAQYPLVSVTNALERLINVKQQEHELLVDYLKRFKQLRDVAKAYMGDKFLHDFVAQQAAYQTADTDGKAAMKSKAYEQWTAYLFIRGSNSTKYKSLLNGLVSQFSLGNDQYPKTLITATDILSTYRQDQGYRDRERGQDQGYRERGRDHDLEHERESGRERDFDHSRNEHSIQDDQDDESSAASRSSSVERDVTCYCCGKNGHYSNECEERDTIPYKKWHIHSVMQQHYQGDYTDSEEEQTDDDESTSGRNRRSGNYRSGTPRPTRRKREPRDIVPWSG
jgi:hypothetical protein